MRQSVLSLVVLVLSACPGASKPAATPAAPPPAAPTAVAPAAAPTAAPAPAASSRIARVVFLDKEHACECTQKAIDASWAALQAALEKGPLPVERIHLDTQDTMAAIYKAKRPLIAVPGLYLLAADDSVVELLQGEVAVEKIRAALGR